MSSCARCGHLQVWHCHDGCTGIIGVADGTLPLRAECSCDAYQPPPRLRLLARLTDYLRRNP